MSETKETTVRLFQLIQWKHAIRLEQKGIKFRRSVRRFACQQLGLPLRTQGKEVIQFIETILTAAQATGSNLNNPIIVEKL